MATAILVITWAVAVMVSAGAVFAVVTVVAAIYDAFWK